MPLIAAHRRLHLNGSATRSSFESLEPMCMLMSGASPTAPSLLPLYPDDIRDATSCDAVRVQMLATRNSSVERRVGKRAAERQLGFTLIEVLVAMVLLAIAVGIVGTIVVQAVVGFRGANSGAVSDSAVTRSVDALTSDVAAAVTPDRRDNRLRDATEMSVFVRTGAVASASNQTTGESMPIDIDDLTMATPTQFRLKADVDRTPGTECVTWIAQTIGTTFTVERRVDPWNGCGGGSLSKKTYISAPSTAAGLDTTPFTYQLICNRTVCPGSSASLAQPCRPWAVEGTVSAAQLRWVIRVDATFTQVAADGATGGEGATGVALRSRDTESYRKALGC